MNDHNPCSYPHRHLCDPETLAALKRAARFRGASDADADDIASETLLRAWRGLSSLKGDDPIVVNAWLWRIFRRTAVDLLDPNRNRARKREISFESAPSEDDPLDDGRTGAAAIDPARRAAHRDELRALRRLMTEDEWRLVCLLAESRDQREAAALLDLGHAAVRKRLCRLRKRIDRGFADAA